MKKLFLNFIDDSKVKNFVDIALQKVDPKFWTAPSSFSGKYHPQENNGEGGLARHTHKVLVIAAHLCKIFRINDWRRDCILAAAILHDTYKCGDVWGGYTDVRHAWIAFERYKFMEADISYQKRENLN